MDLDPNDLYATFGMDQKSQKDGAILSLAQLVTLKDRFMYIGAAARGNEKQKKQALEILEKEYMEAIWGIAWLFQLNEMDQNKISMVHYHLSKEFH